MLKLSLILLVISISLARLETADIQAIFNKMTNEDKCGQMTQVTFQVIEKLPKPTDPEENPIDEAKLRTAIIEKRVGSILNTPYDYAVRSTVWQKMITLIEDVALKETDLKIPIIYGIDSIHGANYIQEAILFPQPLSLGASFNVDLAYGSGMYTAMETRAVGIPWNFNPVLDVGRQPLWPRFWETFGEDSYLASKLGEHYIKGSQGNSLKNRSCVATCLKHYIGYSYPANGLDRSEAYIPEKLLRDVFLPPFAAGVAAGSPTVMINSGNVNGIPGHMNGFYIDDILKGELKFEGFTVSDWEDVVRLHTRDKVAETPEDAVRISVMNGLDMSMVPYDFSFYDHCVNLSKKNPQFVERINDSTMRILKVKDQLGLFEDPYPVASDLNKVGSDAAWQFTLEAAQESIILAKNDANILPLAPNTRILVTGPTGNFLRVLHGGWSYTWQGNDESTFENYGSRPKQTVYAAIKQTVDSAQFVQAVDFNNVIDINAAVTAAQNVDVIVLTIGEDTYTETPGNINDLAISQSQVELANAVLALGKPVVVIYIGGRPRIMTEIGKKANAAILAFLPGNRGGEAIADVLFGRINPSGRLPFTYPAYPNGHNHYDLLPIEQFDLNKYEYLFPFGHGLSYTTFQYSNLQLSTSNLVAPNSLTVSVTVTNTGNRAGKESVLLYVHDVYGSVPRPLKQLKRFTKVNLEPAASQTLTFTLTMDDLSFTDINYKRIYEAGDFNVYIGDLKGSFKLTVNTAATTTARTVPTTKPNSSTRVMITNYFNIFMIILLASSVFFFLNISYPTVKVYFNFL